MSALLQHLLSYLGFSYLGREVSLHGCFSKVQPLLLTLDDGYVLTASMVRSYPRPRSGAAAKSASLRWHRNSREELPQSEVRGGGWEEQPHVQGAVVVWAQEGQEELLHV